MPGIWRAQEVAMRESASPLPGEVGIEPARPRWTPIALVWLLIGCLGVAFAAVTLVVAGMSGALGCLAYGVVAIVVARRARYWS